MRRFSSTAVAESPPVSNRRQPVRQTRTNPPRGAANVAQPPTPAGAPKSAGQNANPGFFPAITHFTDSITALPKELIRNYTMLKEVDAKIHGPEELLGQLVRGVLGAPLPPRKVTPLEHNHDAMGSHNENAITVQLRDTARSLTTNPDDDLDLPRRQVVMNLRMVMNEMFTTLDEKNHVISNAVDELNKQLARCNSSFAHISKEISEEARHGSLSHWAYTEKAAEKKGTLAGERTRRDNAGNNQANLGANQETEGFASRSEMRREALAAKKRPHNHLESDFDDGRASAQTASRKVQANGKSRKPPDPPMTTNNVVVGLGTANGASSAPLASKRRKIEKPTVITPIGVVPVERAMSSVFGTNAVSARGGAGSPSETPAVEAAKKKGRVVGRVNGGSTRQRANTNNSATNSPLIASSPIAGTFPVTKDPHCKSPPSSIVQRAQPSRSRQNSAQTVLPEARNGASSSTLNKAPNKNGAHGLAIDGGKVPSTAGRSIAELKTAMKESLTLKSEHQTEEPLDIDGVGEVRSAGVVSSGRIIERALKREELESGAGKTRPDFPPSISISARGAAKSRPSGPQSATASEPPPPRSRASRTVEPPPIKRSHKKGAGQAAQLEREAAAAAAARANHHDEEGSSIQGEEEEEEEEEEEFDGSEPRYCYCDGVSYGEMVACDMPDCKREWFHLGCVGLAKAPTKNAKWFCNDCLKDKASKIPPSPTTIAVAATVTATSPITAGGR